MRTGVCAPLSLTFAFLDSAQAAIYSFPASIIHRAAARTNRRRNQKGIAPH
jgi:hypothetical protein